MRNEYRYPTEPKVWKIPPLIQKATLERIK